MISEVQMRYLTWTYAIQTGNMSLDFVLWTNVKFDINVGLFTNIDNLESNVAAYLR